MSYVVAGKVSRSLQPRVLRHANKVAKKGHYLEIADLLLYSVKCGVKLKLILNSPSPRIISMYDYLQFAIVDRGLSESCGGMDAETLVQLSEFEESLNSAEGPEWAIVLTRVDLGPSDCLQEMLHWLPAWFENPGQFDYQKCVEGELQRQKETLSQASNRKGFDIEYFQYQSLLSRNFTGLINRFSALKPAVFTRPVPADGDCGCWSLVSLLQTGPLKSLMTHDQHTRDEMFRVRLEISSAWGTVSHHKLWQMLHLHLLPLADQDIQDDEADEAAKDSKVEPKSDMSDDDDGDGNKTNQCVTPKKDDKKAKPSCDEMLNQLSPVKVDKKDRLSSSAGLVRDRADAPSMSALPVMPAPKSEKEAGGKRGKNETKGEKSENYVEHVEDAASPTPKKRRRRLKTEEEIRAVGTKRFLAKQGITYHLWNTVHRNGIFCKRLAVCAGGSFKQLKEHLCSGKQPDQLQCLNCKQMLKKSFNSDQLQEFLDACVATGRVDDLRDDPDLSADNVDKEDAGEGQATADTAGASGAEAWPKQVKLEVPAKEEPEEQDRVLVVGMDGALPKNPKKRQGGRPPLKPSFSVKNKVVQDYNGLFQVLPPGMHGKKFPIQCLLCTAFKHKPIIFDYVTESRMQYVHSHITSGKHTEAVAFRRAQQAEIRSVEAGPDADRKDHEDGGGSGGSDDQGVPDDPDAHDPDQIRSVACQGFVFGQMPHSRVGRMYQEFRLYFTYTDLQATTHVQGQAAVSHRYLYDKSKDEHTIFHAACEKTVNVGWGVRNPIQTEASQHYMCRKCSSLGTSKPLVVQIARFYRKHMSAQLLRATLHQQAGSKQDVVAEIVRNPVYELVEFARKELDELIGWNVPELQAYVREKFLSLPFSRQCEPMKFYIASHVMPALALHGVSCNSDQLGKVEKLARLVTEGNLSSLGSVELKLGCFVASGALRSHPLIQGLLVSMVEKVRREHRGIRSMKGLRLSETETAMVQEAGITLSMTACNPKLMAEFGCLHAKPRTDVANLLQRSLPDAFLANSSLEIMHQNALMVSNLCPKVSDKMPPRYLTMAFDKTYLLKQVNPLRTRLGKGLVGCAWRTHHETVQESLEHCFLELPPSEVEKSEDSEKSANKRQYVIQTIDCAQMDFAREMLLALAWDPLSKHKGLPRWPLLELPMAYECSRAEMTHLIGTVLLHSGYNVRSLVFDNHSSHKEITEALLGHVVCKPDVPFFSELELEPLPATCLLNFQFCIPRFQNQVINALNGPLHLQKNVVSACRSHVRTLYMGSFAVDFAACRDNGMPCGAYCGFDSQSDVEGALFLNPFFLLKEMPDDPNQAKEVPWSLRGALLLNLLQAMLQASVMSQDLSVEQRLENAMCAHCLLDLCRLIAIDREVQHGVPKGSYFLPAVTVKNLQNLAGFIAILCKTIPEEQPFCPWRLCERPMETYFGLLRSQMPTSQLSVRDFVKTSALVSSQFQHQIKEASKTGDKPTHVKEPKQSPVTDEQFLACAERALAGATKLMSLCSTFSDAQLRRVAWLVGGKIKTR